MIQPLTVEQQIEQVAIKLGDACLAQRVQLAMAESCTGGMIAQVITALAGSSLWFDRGFVTYSNAAKTDMLNVSSALIAAQGAVSEGVAQAMAVGAIKHSLADWSAAVTGVAGPSGGTPLKPVGTVWVAFAKREASGAIQLMGAERCQFMGDRHAVRAQTTLYVLTQLLRYLSQRPSF